MKKDRWPVILEDSFRDNVASGWSVIVLCTKDAERVGSAWVGQWHILCQSPDRTDRRVLVLRKNIEPRLILTQHGVTSFLADLGITLSAVPMKRGDLIEITHDRQLLVGREPD